MSKLTCKNCNCFKKAHYTKNKKNELIWRGICLCHGYHILETEEICTDFER